MSFNTIIEAEKEVIETLNSTRENAKKIIQDALLEKTRNIEQVKNQQESDLRSGLVNFETELNSKIKIQGEKAQVELENLRKAAVSKKSEAVKMVVSEFKS